MIKVTQKIALVGLRWDSFVVACHFPFAYRTRLIVPQMGRNSSGGLEESKPLEEHMN